MNYIDVWMTFPDGERLVCGEIAYPAQRVKTEQGSAFRYTQKYLAHPKAFALDPTKLPLEPTEFVCERHLEDIHSVFEDSLPDAWGRRLLSKKYNIQIRNSRLVKLLPYLKRNGLGALSYHSKEDDNKSNSADITSLERLIKVAQELEKGLESDDKALALLFEAGSSPGGARPKALVRDDNTCWLAKFPSALDQYSMVRIECATLTLAQQSGLSIPEHKIIKCGHHEALLVKRFDVTKNNGRNHVVSMRTLLPDSFYHRYADMADVIRQISDHPKHDLEQMYRHMVFNALIGNTDDHDKNFSMLHGESGWKLTPAYDLLPNYGRNPEHGMSFNNNAYPPSKEELPKLGKGAFSLSSKRTETIFHEVMEPISNWQDVFRQHHVPDDEINYFKKDITPRIS
mgnify:CR=1 FL=1